ncbi:MAG: 4Fe-4S dicluster domain-containing protein [Actinomycetota bacterium]|nr:4Fe-4S dicluster domain-containing protein [Actinomycetota bacterium]
MLYQLDGERCSDRQICVSRCPFGAMEFDSSAKEVKLDISKCYGCGVCRHFCPNDALFLVPRDSIPEVCGNIKENIIWHCYMRRKIKISIDYHKCGDGAGIDPRDCCRCLRVCTSRLFSSTRPYGV